MKKLSILIFLAGLLLWYAPKVSAQTPPWTGIVDSSRAIDWSQAGVPGGIPARPTICTTLSAGASLASINAAIAACPSGDTVMLNAGTYNLAGGIIFNNKSNVTLRGADANQTLLVFTSTGNCQGQPASICETSSDQNYYQQPSNTANWTAGYAPGTTSITLSSTTNLAIGNPLILDQLDDTASAPPPSTGIYICETNAGDCALDGPSGTSRTNRAQLQIVTVTGISGNTVTFSPGLDMPNWRSGQTPGAWWATSPVHSDGIENLSIDSSGSGNQSSVMMFNCTGCWVKDIRSIQPARSHIWMWNSPHITVRDSYFYGTQSAAQESYGLEPFPSGDSLFENNIFQKIAAPQTINGPCSGCVISYNYSINNYYTPSSNWQQQSAIDHSVTNFLLFEGNVGAGYYGDNFHGTHHFNTLFRNRYDGRESNNGSTTTEQTNPMILYPLSRYYNIVGNVLGTSGYHTTYQETTNVSGHETDIYILGTQSAGGGYPDDAFTPASLLRWGNYDTVTATNRFVTSEVPTGISPYGNAVPGSNTLPPSFYYSSQPSWWPASVPWPAIGPDVTGGNIANVGGHAYQIPAENCFLTTMGGPADGVGNVLSFNASSCYTAGPAAPFATFAPTSVAFGNQLINTTSGAQTVTLTNTGTAVMTISGISLTGVNAADFSQSNTCGATLSVNASCTFTVHFTPSLLSIENANISVTDNAAGSPQTVPLSGTGTSSTPGIPTLVQHVHGSNTLSSSQGPSWIGGPNNTYTTYLANPTQAGNAIIVGMRFDNSQTPTITVSDDKSNTYNIGNVSVDATNNNKFAIYYALNVAAGTRKINVLLSSSTAATQFAVEASEFYNVAQVSALDGNAGTTGTSTTVATGSVTPTTSGDLVYQIATQGTGSLVTYTVGSQPNITWSLLSADTQKPFAVQYGVYNSTAAFNPTMTQSSIVNFETAAIFLKPATSGSAAPAGIRVNRISHNSLWSSGTGGPGFSTSQVLQFPSVGPMLVAATTTGGGSLNDDVTSITDNNGNTWLQCGPGNTGGNHTSHVYYVANATTGNGELVTVHSINNTGDSTVMLYDVSGASTTSPCDTSASASGNQTTAVSSLVGPTVTPTTINGLVFGVIQQYNGTVVSLSNAAILNDAELFSQENLNGPENVDQNGGYAHFYNSTTNPVNFTWNYQLDGSNTPEDFWNSYAAAFKAANASAPIATLAPTSIAFPNEVIPASSAPVSVTLTNTGTATLAISSISITGNNPGDFSQTNNCAATLAISTSCTINVTFTPTAAGVRTANVAVADNAAGTPQLVALSGTSANVSSHHPTLIGSLPSGVVGTPYTGGLTVTGDTPPDVWSANFTIPGVVLNTATGAFTGLPTTAGTYSGTVIVTDSFSCGTDPNCTNTATSAVSATINPAPTAPVITVQPANTTAVAGTTAKFSVTATGTAPLTYQWQLNAKNISGATSATYTTPVLATSDSGAKYTVIVSNSVGSVTSSQVTLTVTAAPSKYVLEPSPTSFSFTASGSATITINDSTPNSLPLTVASDSPWLSFCLTHVSTKVCSTGTASVSTATLATGTVSVSTTGLAAGTYTGHIVITAGVEAGGVTVNNSPYSIPVTLVVSAPPPLPPAVTTTCGWLSDNVTWQCSSVTSNVPSGQAIKTVVTVDGLTNTVTGTKP
jgi:hypothetical protein